VWVLAVRDSAMAISLPYSEIFVNYNLYQIR
ncbi:hypothetical protein NIES298_47050, partial [Microcystis aeruginosa NIES-298]